MKIYIFILSITILGILLNFINYNYFLTFLSILWYLASLLILYLAIKNTLKYQFIQLNIKEIIKGIKSKSNNNISPLSSLCISLAAKIGVGSLSGIALAIYFGGIGTIFWIIVISLLTAINTYLECILGIKYRERINNILIGGPSYYIKKCLNNHKLSLLYSILIIISYGILFLSIQSNTIITVTNYFNINNYLVIFLLFITILLIIIKGLNGISKVNSILVPLMLFIYLIIGIIIVINNYQTIPSILLKVIKEAFKLKSIIPVFLIGMQRAIFITESSIGTSAISASTCDNNPSKQGMLEVFGIYITVFIVCITTFLIIVTSNYHINNFNNINGIEIVLYSFNYHFGEYGSLILSIITIMFALSTIISSYFLGESNLLNITKNKIINIIYKIIFMLVIIISCYIKPNILWNLTDFFVALLVIINVYAILKITTNNIK